MKPTLRVVVVAALAACFVPVLRDLVHVWSTDTYAGHGVFVPVFSATLVWIDRERLRAAAGKGSATGLGVMAAGLVLLALGRGWPSLMVQGVSLVVAVGGAALWVFGSRLVRAAAFPVGFLIFMAPLPREVVTAVTLDIQRFVASFAGATLQLLDVPVYQTGMILQLPNMTLEVAEVCNGLRFLMALLVLTMAFGYVMVPGVIRRLVLVAAAVPIAVVANAFRVTMIGVAVYHIGPHAASGFIHDNIGKAVWALTLVPLGGLGLLLRWTAPPRGPGATSRTPVVGGERGMPSTPPA